MRVERRRSRDRAGCAFSGAMPGLWERLAGGERGRLETSDCESLGSASGSEGGECGSLKAGGLMRVPGRRGGGAVPSPYLHPQNPWIGVSQNHQHTPVIPRTPGIGVSHAHGTPVADLPLSFPQMPSTPRGSPCRTWTWSCCTTRRTSCCAPA